MASFKTEKLSTEVQDIEYSAVLKAFVVFKPLFFYKNAFSTNYKRPSDNSMMVMTIPYKH